MAGWGAAGPLEEEEDYLGHIIPQPDERLVAKHTKDNCFLAGQESSATNVGLRRTLKIRGFGELQRKLWVGKRRGCSVPGEKETV